MKQQAKLLANLQTIFERHADSERAHHQQAYLKSEMPHWGIRVPEVRKMCKTIFKQSVPKDNDEYRQTVLYLFEYAKHREEWYAGLNYAKAFKKFITPENFDVYLSVVRITQWWDIVDDTAVWLVGGALQKVDDIRPFLQSWIVDDNMWIRRTALLAQLKYKEKTDHNLLAELIQTVMHEKEFFIRKAIGWVLREYSYINPEWVKSFIEQHKNELSNLSIREGLKAINRS